MPECQGTLETGTISEAQVTAKGLGIYQIRPVWLNGWVFIYKLNVVGSNSVAVRKIFLLRFKKISGYLRLASYCQEIKQMLEKDQKHICP